MPSTVLVFDQSAAMRESIAQVLQQAGYQVVLAQNGNEAFTVLNGNRISIVLAGMDDPLWKDNELIGKISRETGNHRIPLVIMSSEIIKEKTIGSDTLGIAGYIVKPFSAKKLLQCINEVIGRFKPYDKH